MRDRRNRRRRKTPHYLNVVDSATGQVLGRLVNITAGGMMVVSRNKIMPDREFRLRLLLPRMVNGEDELQLQACSIWCRPDENPAFHRIGFKFLQVDERDAFVLEDVMHTFHLVG
ncbi:MAG: PilZ domain-containing protein [Candidatus Krumholzibacteriia bacterium]